MTGRARSERPVVCLLAPPRSGSTLTYQVLTTAIDGLHLTNIWNLLGSTPLIGGLLSKRLCRNRKSTFQSTQGFVPGLCGEAEGLAFWTHWTGQTLSESTSQWKPSASAKLKRRIDLLSSSDQPFITGYLGHVFCISELRALFPRIVFVHLTRDLNANALSLYRAAADRWFSTLPKSCNTGADRWNQIADQLVTIHEAILEQFDSADTFQASYDQVCDSPRTFLSQLNEFSKTRNIDLPINLDLVPEKFKKRDSSQADESVTSKLHIALLERLKSASPQHRDFLDSLLEK